MPSAQHHTWPEGDLKVALKSVARDRHLPYRRPLPLFIPAVVLFLLMNYLAFCTEVDVTGMHVVLPEYVRTSAERRAVQRNLLAAGELPTGSLPFDPFLFFEDRVMGTLFHVGRRCFGSLFGIQVVCAVAWIIHAFELGVCARICWSCNASPLVALRYAFCTACSGFAQLATLKKARDAWLAEVHVAAAEKTRADTATAHASTSAERKKKS